jgi:hypothetical protein
VCSGTRNALFKSALRQSPYLSLQMNIILHFSVIEGQIARWFESAPESIMFSYFKHVLYFCKIFMFMDMADAEDCLAELVQTSPGGLPNAHITVRVSTAFLLLACSSSPHCPISGYEHGSRVQVGTWRPSRQRQH